MMPYLDKPLSVGILSIDTGSISLGVSYSVFNYQTGIQEVVMSTTFKIQTVIRHGECNYNHAATNNMNNTAAIYNVINSLCQTYQPDIVVAEASFLGRFPTAFASLTLALNAIERACYDYDIDVGFATIDPPTVKNCVGVTGKSSDKEDMRQAVQSHPFINLGIIDISLLDEHAIDSIAIGYSYYRLTTS